MPRPTKYKKKFCQELINYFKKSPYFDTVEEEVYDKKRQEVVTLVKKVPALCPSFVRFAGIIKVNPDTLQQWKKTYPDFEQAMDTAKKYQEEWLMNAGGLGYYNSSVAIMALKSNHGWKDRVDNTGDSSFTIVEKKYNYEGEPIDTKTEV